ncbi:MAG: DNA cytosine methyltransferase [Ignavibacteria bacterium]
MALKAIDFFCGIGGVTRAFLNKNIDVIAGIDNDITCKETYEINNIRPNGLHTKFLHEDITNFDVKIVNSMISKKKDDLILIGCAPCQPFTQITKNLGKRHKERGLLKCFSDIILKLKPKYVFLENVEGLKSDKNKEILINFINSLKPSYNLIPQVVNAKNYGVPQSRKRVILFGKRKGIISFPDITHSDELGYNSIKTLYEVIGNLPHLHAGETHSSYRNHTACKLTGISLKRLQYQKEPGDGMTKWPIELQLNSRRSKQYKGHNDVYSRMFWDKPSGTLTTKFVSISNGRFAHPEQNRGLSILEGLLIQSFPRNFKLLHKSIRIQAKQIGNAVPVKLAEAFAQKIIEDYIN